MELLIAHYDVIFNGNEEQLVALEGQQTPSKNSAVARPAPPPPRRPSAPSVIEAAPPPAAGEVLASPASTASMVNAGTAAVNHRRPGNPTPAARNRVSLAEKSLFDLKEIFLSPFFFCRHFTNFPSFSLLPLPICLARCSACGWRLLTAAQCAARKPQGDCCWPSNTASAATGRRRATQ